MDSLEYLDRQLNQCNALINKINSIRSELMKAYQSLETATTIGMYYSVDNVSADGNNIEKQRSNILAIYNHFGSIVSNVNNTISSINRQISEEKSRIKHEEELEEQEEKKNNNNSSNINQAEIQNILRKLFNFNLWK